MRRGSVGAASLGIAPSSREDCLYCDGPAEHPCEMFEWEVQVIVGNPVGLGACGASSGHATAMDALRTALRKLDPETVAWGRIIHRVYEFGAAPDGWRRQVIFHASRGPAGTVVFDRIQT
ncbi:hypothetical protein [Spongiactinospora sp. TRM90649]|uniref:hypothetical protein n=1 Tax=Spongiactinospora sp. TRM90649 TaxID=3031114 RepID=UPI0023F8F68A|nr:hypothetical protein [Spongiactinospora sp. TRM90649]MDF5753035.1 hypothetical protein [Spongiactinospora sp. TRM90649]